MQNVAVNKGSPAATPVRSPGFRTHMLEPEPGPEPEPEPQPEPEPEPEPELKLEPLEHTYDMAALHAERALMRASLRKHMLDITAMQAHYDGERNRVSAEMAELRAEKAAAEEDWERRHAVACAEHSLAVSALAAERSLARRRWQQSQLLDDDGSDTSSGWDSGGDASFCSCVSTELSEHDTLPSVGAEVPLAGASDQEVCHVAEETRCVSQLISKLDEPVSSVGSLATHETVRDVLARNSPLTDVEQVLVAEQSATKDEPDLSPVRRVPPPIPDRPEESGRLSSSPVIPLRPQTLSGTLAQTTEVIGAGRLLADTCEQLLLAQQSEQVLCDELQSERKLRNIAEGQLMMLREAAREAEDELAVVLSANSWLLQDERRQMRNKINEEKIVLEERIVLMDEEHSRTYDEKVTEAIRAQEELATAQHKWQLQQSQLLDEIDLAFRREAGILCELQAERNNAAQQKKQLQDCIECLQDRYERAQQELEQNRKKREAHELQLEDRRRTEIDELKGQQAEHLKAQKVQFEQDLQRERHLWQNTTATAIEQATAVAKAECAATLDSLRREDKIAAIDAEEQIKRTLACQEVEHALQLGSRQEQLDKLFSELSSEQAEVATLRAGRQQLQAELLAEKQAMLAKDAELKDALTTRHEVETELSATQQELEVATIELLQMRKRNSASEKVLDKADAQVSELEKTVAAMAEQIDAAEAANAKLRREITSVRADRADDQRVAARAQKAASAELARVSQVLGAEVALLGDIKTQLEAELQHERLEVAVVTEANVRLLAERKEMVVHHAYEVRMAMREKQSAHAQRKRALEEVEEVECSHATAMAQLVEERRRRANLEDRLLVWKHKATAHGNEAVARLDCALGDAAA